MMLEFASGSSRQSCRGMLKSTKLFLFDEPLVLICLTLYSVVNGVTPNSGQVKTYPWIPGSWLKFARFLLMQVTIEVLTTVEIVCAWNYLMTQAPSFVTPLCKP